MRLTHTTAAARMMSLGRGRTLAAAAGRRLALSPTSPSSESSSKVPRGRPETSSERVPSKIQSATYVGEADSASLRPQRGSPRGRAPIVGPLSPCDRSAEKLQQGHCRLVTRRSSVHSGLRQASGEHIVTAIGTRRSAPCVAAKRLDAKAVVESTNMPECILPYDAWGDRVDLPNRNDIAESRRESQRAAPATSLRRSDSRGPASP